MLPIEEVKKWLIENRTNEIGDLDLSCLDFSDFDGNVDISELKVKKSLKQSWQKVGGDLHQIYQEADGRIFYDFGSLNYDFKKMSPAEKGEFIIQIFGGDDGKVLIDNVDLPSSYGDVEINGWKVNGNLSQCGHKVACNLFQDRQEVKGSLSQSLQRVSLDLMQNGQVAGGAIYQDNQKAETRVYQEPGQGQKPLTPKDKGQFLLRYFKNERGDLDLSHVDLSDFHGDVVLEGWKVGGNLFLDNQEAKGNLYQNHQEVDGDLYQDSQKVGWNLHQEQQLVGGEIIQDEQKAKDECKCPDMCVEPDYKAEYERLSKELREANRKIEILMWVLMKIKEEAQ